MENWEHKNLTNDEMKQLVRDVFDDKIFTNFQCDNSITMMVFMPLFFIGQKPTAPSETSNNQTNRKNKLQYIEDCLIYDKETEKREEYLKNIGMVYEYFDKAGPRGINGYPIFYSCNIISIDDTKKFKKMFNEYTNIRDKFESEWNKVE